MQLEISVLKGWGSQKRAFHALNTSSENWQDLCCWIELEMKTNQALGWSVLRGMVKNPEVVNNWANSSWPAVNHCSVKLLTRRGSRTSWPEHARNQSESGLTRKSKPLENQEEKIQSKLGSASAGTHTSVGTGFIILCGEIKGGIKKKTMSLERSNYSVSPYPEEVSAGGISICFQDME